MCIHLLVCPDAKYVQLHTYMRWQPAVSCSPTPQVAHLMLTMPESTKPVHCHINLYSQKCFHVTYLNSDHQGKTWRSCH